jgi:hypothetical protein
VFPNAEDPSLSLSQAQRAGKARREQMTLMLLGFFAEALPAETEGHFGLISRVFGIDKMVSDFERRNCNAPQLAKELLLTLALEALRRVV